MTINAGRVELDIVALARDQMTATMREVNKTLGETKKQLDATKGASSQATTAMQSQQTVFGRAKDGVLTLSRAQEGLNKVLGLTGFIGIVGGVVSGLSALFDLLSGDESIPEFARDVTAAASAEYVLAQRVAQLSKEAEGATKNVNALRIATLSLGAANADVAGDEKRAAELRRQGGIETIVGSVKETEKELEKLSKLQDEALDKRAEAEARAKQLSAEATRAQFEFFEAGRSGDARRQGLAAAAVLEANIAKGLAENDMTEAERVFKETSETIRARNDMIREQRQALSNAEARGIGDIAFDPMTISPDEPGVGGDGGGVDLVAEWKLKMARLPSPARSAAALKAEENRFMRQLDEWAGGDGAKLNEHARQVDELSAAYRNFADVLGSELAPILPGIGEAISALGDSFAGIVESDASDSNKAIAGVSGLAKATFMLAGAQAETAQARYTYKALENVAAAAEAAAYGDVRGAILHGVAATGYGIAAASAGGSGPTSTGSGASGSGPSMLDRAGGSSDRGGPATVVINVAPGTDPQTVARELRRIDYGARGTGFANPGV